MPSAPEGWISAFDAVREYGIDYQALRKMIAQGVFTRGQFSAAAERPPIFVRVVELEAWKAGGVKAVAPVKAAFEATTKVEG